MGLFSKKAKKEPKNVIGFVLLSEPQWDRYLFVADFQADWGVDLDAGKILGAEGEDVVRGVLGGVHLTVTFMDFPLENEDPPVQTAHQAHIIVLTDGESDKLETVRDQAIRSLLKQKHAIGIYVDGTERGR